jgi:signal transduction histidine kinase
VERATVKKQGSSATFLQVEVGSHEERALARQRARQACRLLGVEPQRAARFGVALTEVLVACDGAVATVSLDLEAESQERWLVARTRVPHLDRETFESRLAREPGALPAGLEVGRLVDLWQLGMLNRDLVAELHLELPIAGWSASPEALARSLAEEIPHDASVECERQHAELLMVVGELFRKEVELARLGVQLEETSTGVVALHAELDQAARLAERRELEAIQLRDNAIRMRELERMKSDFLNLASHELRAPIAVLRGYVSMLEDGSLGSLSESMRAVVPVMTGKLREMNLMINQMLETARLEDSRLILTQERIDLREVLAGAGEVMRPIAADHHEILVDAGVRRVLVDADRSRLTTILTNLIDNAIKYSPQGGEVRCRLQVGRGGARLSVADSGLGIEGEDLPRLFTRFGRLVNAENSHIPGTGLGLYLSRELARMHGGDIEVESTPGQGSVFTLRLPVAATT